jgi:hypothetical protein
MTRLMTAVRLGAVMLLAVAIIGATGIFSFSSVSAAGRAGVSKVPALFQGNGHGGGNGNGHGGGNGNGNGNGNAGQGGQQGAEQENGDAGHGKKDKKAKKDKANKQNKAEDQADDSADDSHKNPQAGNVDCSDVEAMIEYLTNRNMNGAIHANENGADNAALGALNKCKAPGQQGAADEEGTPVADEATPEVEASPVDESGTPVADDESGDEAPVSVEVDIDEDGNGEIRYDLDGDGEPDLTMIIEDGKVVDYVEAGADDATPAATPDSEAGE